MNRILKSIWFSFFIIFAASISLGFWIKTNQLKAISDHLLSHYPVFWIVTTILQVLLIFITLWLILAALLRVIDHSSQQNQILHISAIPFLVFLIPLFGVIEPTLLFQTQLFSMIAGVALLRAFSRNKAMLMKIREPVSVFAFLAVVFLLLLHSFSPLFSINPLLDSWGRAAEWLNFEHQWEMAKAFDYSVPNFTQFAKLGGTTTGVFYFSELSSFLMLLLDIPIVDLEAKYTIVKYMLFSLYIFASFGMYLFLRYGLDLSFIPSLIGGLGTIFGNGAILSFFGFEYISHHGDYLFLPWVFLFLKLGYKKNSIGLIGLAGLISTLAEYVLSPHPSLSMLSYFFLNIYNIFLALKNSWVAEKWENRSKLFFCWVMIFPSFIAIGMAFRYLPLFILSLENDFGVTSYNAGGMLWAGKLYHIASLFFHYETMPGISHYHVGPSGSQILFTTGQFITFFIFSLIVYLFFRRQKSSPLRANDLVSQQDVWFFLVTFLLILINAWWGVSSPYAAISRFFEMGLVKYFPRLNIYFFFFALTTAMYGFHFVCKSKDPKILNVTSAVYVVILSLVYFTPALTPVKPEPKHLFFDVIILVFIYSIFQLYFNLEKKPQSGQGQVFLKSLALIFLLFIPILTTHLFFHDIKATFKWFKVDGSPFFFIYMGVLFVIFLNWKSVQKEGYKVYLYPVIVLISLATFLTQNYQSRLYMKNKVPLPPAAGHIQDTFFSMRTAVMHLRNNTHDQASFNYLKTRWQQFIIDLKDTKIEKSSKLYPMLANNNPDFDANSLEHYERVAPLIDKFYLDKNYFRADRSPAYSVAPLVLNYYGASQYYLPNKYSLYFYGENQSGAWYPYIRPSGKNADINSYPTSTLASYSRHFPSINVYFHLLYIYNKPTSDITWENWKYKPTTIEDYPFPTRTLLDKIPFDKMLNRKLMNIIGLDYFLYRKEGYPHLEDKLKVAGFIPTNLAESVRVKILKNPDSYGRAYIADWVKTIKPEEDFKNRYGPLNIKTEWPWDFSLQKNFLNLISSIPTDSYRRATLIESPDPNEYSPEPTIHSKESQVNIVKILATKAMFEVEAKEDNTWFVYNSAALKGWRAFSGSSEVPIRKANLGFMGIKLNKGKHMIWMEYRPVSLFIGFFVTIGGWIMVTFFLLRYPILPKPT